MPKPSGHKHPSRTQELETLLELITGNIRDVVMICNADGNAEYVTPSIERMLGYAPESWLGRPIWEFIHPEETVGASILLKRGNNKMLEVRALHAAGHYAWLEVTPKTMGERLVLAVRDVTEHRDYEAEIAQLLNYDVLTGLPNRWALQAQAGPTLDTALKLEQSWLVLHLDIERFKAVNDTFGHDAGDALLASLANRLSECARSGDVLARLGGDEFALLYQTDMRNLDMLLKRIRETLSEPMPLGAALYQPQIRVGVAVFPEHGHEILELLKAADIALAEAKSQNVSHRVYDPNSNPYHPERFAIEHRLREGISKRELVAHYQSIFDLRTKQTVGFEALVRWQRQGRLIPPGDFIPVAEQTRLVGALDRAVIEMGLQQMARWKTDGFEPEVSFNLSAQSLSILADLTWLTDLIAEHGLDPRNMVFELTESAMLENRALTQRVLGSLRSIGSGVAIDDFGSGYASLAYLRHLPVTRLKLDRTLTAHIGSGNREEKLLLSAMQLGQNLGLEVLAEGVETPEQVHWLEAHRCDMVQGFLFGHPRSAGDLMMQQYHDKPVEKKVVALNHDAALIHITPSSV